MLFEYQGPLKNNTNFYMYRVYVTLYHEQIQDYVCSNISKGRVILCKYSNQTVFSI